MFGASKASPTEDTHAVIPSVAAFGIGPAKNPAAEGFFGTGQTKAKQPRIAFLQSGRHLRKVVVPPDAHRDDQVGLVFLVNAPRNICREMTPD